MENLQLGELHEYENKIHGTSNIPQQEISEIREIYIPQENLSWIEPLKTPVDRYSEMVKKMNNIFQECTDFKFS